MFQHYDEPARRVIFFGRFEAGALGVAEIDTEHLLLGLFREDQSLLDRLAGAPIDVEAIRQKIRDRTGGGETTPTSVDMPLSMAAKRVLLDHLERAKRPDHERISTEHILFGLLAEEEGFAAEILRGLGVSIETVRDDLAERQSEN